MPLARNTPTVGLLVSLKFCSIVEPSIRFVCHCAVPLQQALYWINFSRTIPAAPFHTFREIGSIPIVIGVFIDLGTII